MKRAVIGLECELLNCMWGAGLARCLMIMLECAGLAGCLRRENSTEENHVSVGQGGGVLHKFLK